MEAKSKAFFTDTHAHLASSRFVGCLPELLTRASEAGIGRIVSISCDLEDVESNLAIAASGPGIFTTAGIHPCYVHEPGPEGWGERLRVLARAPEIVAIGEIGLDFYHPPQDGTSEAAWRGRQHRVFEEMLQLATDLDLPAVIHQRESFAPTLDVLQAFPKVRAVLHCFTGGPAEAERALAAGHFLSFTGVLTYPKSEEVRAAAAIAPVDRIFVETDAPYLAPVPFRGKTCEPSMVAYTARRLGELHGLGPDEIAKLTSENAEKFFRLRGPLLSPGTPGTALAPSVEP